MRGRNFPGSASCVRHRRFDSSTLHAEHARGTTRASTGAAVGDLDCRDDVRSFASVRANVRALVRLSDQHSQSRATLGLPYARHSETQQRTHIRANNTALFNARLFRERLPSCCRTTFRSELFALDGSSPLDQLSRASPHWLQEIE